MRPGCYVHPIFVQNLFDEQVEVRSLDKLMLGVLKLVGLFGSNIFPHGCKLSAAWFEIQESVSENEIRLRHKTLYRSSSGYTCHLIRAIRSAAGISFPA